MEVIIGTHNAAALGNRERLRTLFIRVGFEQTVRLDHADRLRGCTEIDRRAGRRIEQFGFAERAVSSEYKVGATQNVRRAFVFIATVCERQHIALARHGEITLAVHVGDLERDRACFGNAVGLPALDFELAEAETEIEVLMARFTGNREASERAKELRDNIAALLDIAGNILPAHGRNEMVEIFFRDVLGVGHKRDERARDIFIKGGGTVRRGGACKFRFKRHRRFGIDVEVIALKVNHTRAVADLTEVDDRASAVDREAVHEAIANAVAIVNDELDTVKRKRSAFKRVVAILREVVGHARERKRAREARRQIILPRIESKRARVDAAARNIESGCALKRIGERTRAVRFNLNERVGCRRDGARAERAGCTEVKRCVLAERDGARVVAHRVRVARHRRRAARKIKATEPRKAARDRVLACARHGKRRTVVQVGAAAEIEAVDNVVARIREVARNVERARVAVRRTESTRASSELARVSNRRSAGVVVLFAGLVREFEFVRNEQTAFTRDADVEAARFADFEFAVIQKVDKLQRVVHARRRTVLTRNELVAVAERAFGKGDAVRILNRGNNLDVA